MNIDFYSGLLSKTAQKILDEVSTFSDYYKSSKGVKPEKVRLENSQMNAILTSLQAILKKQGKDQRLDINDTYLYKGVKLEVK